MNRLTKKIGNHYTVDKPVDAFDVLAILGKYEDTNLTPEQIKEIDKLYLEKCQEVNKLKAGGWKMNTKTSLNCYMNL